MATSLLERLSRQLSAGVTSPRAVLAALAVSDPGAVLEVSAAELMAVDPTLASFADIDTPSDLARLRDRTAFPPS
jgi:CTP:molybdopterin cytidylyltransferase MocA